MLRVVVAFGTRPEGIKMLPVVRALRAIDGIDVQVVVTGQHREMLRPVFSVFKESFDINLDVMTENQTLSTLTASILTRMTAYLDQHQPNLVLVHGDTTTAFAVSVASLYSKCKIGHVEAGLRSYDLSRPWPEEFNRIAIDSMADFMFAPTRTSAKNLSREYHKQDGVYVTGNTGIDALLFVSNAIDNDRSIKAELDQKYGFLDGNQKLVVVTGHRRESFGQGFEGICAGIRKLAESGPVQIVYPVHLNPNVRLVVRERISAASNVFLIDPVDYIEMVYLMKRAHLLLTDSGGIQEEGPALGKPVLVMRDVTERPEALETGVVQLVGTDPDRIASQAVQLLDPEQYARRARKVFPYGDGRASTKIASIIQERLFT